MFKLLFSTLMLSVVSLLLFSCAPEPVTPETALQRYLANNDKTFAWELRDSFELEDIAGYNVLLTSQQWHEYTWQHQLTLLVPAEVRYDGALLFITGGRNVNGQPKWKDANDDAILMMRQVALENHAPVAIIWQVPNQPLFGDLYEDEIISYTLHQYRQDKDMTWPLLFPMVKSAVRAMDALQEFSEQQLDLEIKRFVVSGASKRGWTTWLTGAQDERVAAIGPMVIDVLNMPVQMDYQVDIWGDYSHQIQDYVRLGIAQDVRTKDGEELSTMIDPYSYRDKLTLPKLIFIGTNDEYWPVDAVKHYFGDIPGKNFIHYVPNAGHDLGGGQQAVQALSAFFAETLQNVPYPELQWDFSLTENRVTLTVQVDTNKLVSAQLWQAESDDRDFRDALWTSDDISTQIASPLQIEIELPVVGYFAFYVDVIYPHPNGGSYSKSTRMFVLDASGIL